MQNISIAFNANANMFQNIMHQKLKDMIAQSGIKQKELAVKLGTNEIHLNKVLNGRATLTTRMAKKLSSIKELNTSEQELIYPSLPLDIAGFCFDGLPAQLFKTSRPQLYVPTSIEQNWYGVVYRGSEREDALFHHTIATGDCLVFDGIYEKDKSIDPKSVGYLSCLENNKGEIWIGYLGNKNKKGKYSFQAIGSQAYLELKVIWSSAFVMALNLNKLEGVDNLLQLD